MSAVDGLTGLTDLAVSLRRSTALTVAMSITPETGTEADLLATADRLLVWLDAGRPDPAPTTYTPPGWSPQ